MNSIKDKKIQQIIILEIVAILMLLIALANNPYGYYQILRWAIFCITCYIVYFYYSNNNKHIFILLFSGIAILFNPIFPIYLNREIWSFLNIIVVFIFFIDILRTKKINMIRIFKSKIFWIAFLVITILVITSLFIAHKIDQKRIEDAKCKFDLEKIVENRYFRDTEPYTTTFLSRTYSHPATHMVYWEIDSLLKNNASKRQYLHSMVLKIYTKDDRNILLTESYLDVKKWLEPRQSLPFQVRASFNRDNEILSKYFNSEEDVRIDLYPNFSSCNY